MFAQSPLINANARADFNGDGYEDLVVGVPGEDVGNVINAGAVHVFYGNPAGVLNENQLWHLNSFNVPLNAVAGDRFGSALTTGDFDGDGYADLAVGIPFKDNEKGQVLVLYGTATGLTGVGSQVWNQDNLADLRENGDQFGSALTSGDFNSDGYSDLAIGVPKEDFPDVGPPQNEVPKCGICPDAGVVHVVLGGPAGLTSNGNALWHQDRGVNSFDGWVEWQDCFGASLDAGDFDGNGADDLAVGAICEQTGGAGEGDINNGAVSVYYGTPGVGLTGFGSVYLRQWAAGVVGWPTKHDAFGYALAVGDFNTDGFDDLAVGIPGEEDDCQSATDAGAVAVFYGKANGGVTPTDNTRNELWCRNSAGMLGSGSGRWGSALAAGDFNSDGVSDLAIGAPLDNIDGITEAGSVSVLNGSASRLTTNNNQLFNQNSSGIPDVAEEYDWFGHTLTAVDFNGDGIPDLAVGVPFENLGGIVNSGAVNLLFGLAGVGISSLDNHLFHQNSPGTADENEYGDEFGGRLLPQLYSSPWPNNPPEGVDNQPPKWNPIAAQTVQEGQMLSLTVSAIDQDGPSPLALSATHLPIGASFTDTGGGIGELTWIPPVGAAAQSPYFVTLTASDDGGDGLSSDVILTIDVLPQAKPPQLDPIPPQTITEGQLLVFRVTATYIDGPLPLVLSMSNAPIGARFTDFGNGTGEFTWTPPDGAASTSPYLVTFTVTDDGGKGLSDSETVSIDVQAPSNIGRGSGGGGGGCTLGTGRSPDLTLPLLVFLSSGYFIMRRQLHGRGKPSASCS
jgi:hypothetical protein